MSSVKPPRDTSVELCSELFPDDGAQYWKADFLSLAFTVGTS